MWVMTAAVIIHLSRLVVTRAISSSSSSIDSIQVSTRGGQQCLKSQRTSSNSSSSRVDVHIICECCPCEATGTAALLAGPARVTAAAVVTLVFFVTVTAVVVCVVTSVVTSVVCCLQLAVR
jgi:hypothetical protein